VETAVGELLRTQESDFNGEGILKLLRRLDKRVDLLVDCANKITMFRWGKQARDKSLMNPCLVFIPWGQLVIEHGWQ